jgi:3-oxoacyl-[acyl-carrier-protein] synthase-3
MSEHFPFTAAGGAMLCRWSDDEYGLGRFHWTNHRDGGESFSATVGLRDAHNVLRFQQSELMDQQFAQAAAEAADGCLRESGLSLADVDVIIAAPARAGYRAALAELLGVPLERVIVAGNECLHTAALVAAFGNGLPPGTRALIAAAGAGVTAGAALYREPV